MTGNHEQETVCPIFETNCLKEGADFREMCWIRKNFSLCHDQIDVARNILIASYNPISSTSTKNPVDTESELFKEVVQVAAELIYVPAFLFAKSLVRELDSMGYIKKDK